MSEPEKHGTETLPSSADSATKPKPKKKSKSAPNPAKKPPATLPKWKVLLHNDDNNDMIFVVMTIVELTPLNQHDAKDRMLEAHKNGVALLLVTHKERAELYKDQFQSKGLLVSIEPEN
ncbi:MAG TPA: ATP-dependent Clp protease adaptor ClpS [Tepidisphaeraceae bacterium]|jgi:ATP-dependent Clp protease adaptor protein ClpS|nr:ATP-dependent Clp protease adaptor ClpS [Tepidisphaeraceae bacterium]